MLKIPNYCKLYTSKCHYFDWGLGERPDPTFGIDGVEEELPRTKQMNPCCMKHLREILWYLADLFEEQQIFYWIDFGTLLGAIRGGRAIPHDTDGDMCLLLEDRDRVLSLEDRARRDGFLLNWIKPKNDTHIKVCRSKKNFMIVDLFFWVHNKETGIYNGDGLNLPKGFPDWWLERDKMEKVRCFDKLMWAPREPEKFLRMRFGKDWKVPQNKKVHHGEAAECHKWGFSYASDWGWKRKGVVV